MSAETQPPCREWGRHLFLLLPGAPARHLGAWSSAREAERAAAALAERHGGEVFRDADGSWIVDADR